MWYILTNTLSLKSIDQSVLSACNDICKGHQMLIRHISVSHVDSVQEMFDHVFIINFIPILTCLSDFFIVLLVNKQASNSWYRHFPTSQTCAFNIQLYAVTISLRQFTFNNQYNYHYRIKMMDFLQPCSLTEKFIILFQKRPMLIWWGSESCICMMFEFNLLRTSTITYCTPTQIRAKDFATLSTSLLSFDHS